MLNVINSLEIYVEWNRDGRLETTALCMRIHNTPVCLYLSDSSRYHVQHQRRMILCSCQPLFRSDDYSMELNYQSQIQSSL